MKKKGKWRSDPMTKLYLYEMKAMRESELKRNRGKDDPLTSFAVWILLPVFVALITFIILVVFSMIFS